MPVPLPAHVALVDPMHVRLGGELKALLPALREGPYGDRVFRDEQLRVCLRRESADNPLLDLDLAAMLGWLAREGFAFLELMNQPYGPAELMRALRADGSVGVEFDSLIVRGPEDWARAAN